jgi:GWxTD domain-containing protein
MRRAPKAALAAGLVLLVLLGACRLYRLERSLPLKYGDFLNKARYIVSAAERREFLETPDAEKDAFIETFWKNRDPDPATEENEFKKEYFDRLERAGKIFISEGLPGWLTDRGRIYILFGPPTDRITQPVGGDYLNRCQEVWYYGNFPVVFVDETCTGNYKLVSYDLTALRDINLSYMHELAQAQESAQTPLREERRMLDYEAGLSWTTRASGRAEGRLRIEVPYGKIWFKSEGARLSTTFDISLEAQDANKTVLWQRKEAVEVALSEDDLKAQAGRSHALDVPILIDDPVLLSAVGRGGIVLAVTLVNRTGGETVRKTLDFK